MRRKQNDDYNVWHFRRFLFGIVSPDVPTKFMFLLVTSYLESEWKLVIDILNQILLTILTFIALQILRRVSKYCARLLFGVC